ncbi:MAG: DUF3071 domain-containing protein [Actinobacteria bacterium]|nr:MAG: DUF3071 domain-containing protein [Actinomycetota bacterium]
MTGRPVRGLGVRGWYRRREPSPRAGPAPPGARVQQLHLVGFTTDLEGLIFSIRKGSKSGGYVIVLDEDLMTKIDEAQRLRNGAAGRPAAGDEPAPRTTATHTSPGRPAAPRLDKPPRPESALSPREIQSRLRSGSSIAQVATDAGVDEEWIARFADPVIAEQDQVAGGARRMFFTKPRRTRACDWSTTPTTPVGVRSTCTGRSGWCASRTCPGRSSSSPSGRSTSGTVSSSRGTDSRRSSPTSSRGVGAARPSSCRTRRPVRRRPRSDRRRRNRP